MLDFPRWKVAGIWLLLAALVALAIPSLLAGGRRRIDDGLA